MSSGYQYTFIVQCKELINHAMTRIVATVRIEGDISEFMKALENLQCDPSRIKQIYIGDVEQDFSTAPVIEKDTHEK